MHSISCLRRTSDSEIHVLLVERTVTIPDTDALCIGLTNLGDQSEGKIFLRSLEGIVRLMIVLCRGSDRLGLPRGELYETKPYHVHVVHKKGIRIIERGCGLCDAARCELLLEALSSRTVNYSGAFDISSGMSRKAGLRKDESFHGQNGMHVS